MKKILLFLSVVFLGTVCSANSQTLPQHLVCRTSLSEHDPNVKESYDYILIVRVGYLENDFQTNLEALKQLYDRKVKFKPKKENTNGIVRKIISQKAIGHNRECSCSVAWNNWCANRLYV